MTWTSSTRLRARISVQGIIDRIKARNIQAVVCDTSTPSIINDVRVLDAL
jgi:anaerobic magnesium-protoporphyrin IX monomethyl ester cyclase